MHGPYGVSVRSGCLLLCALAVAAAADQVKVEGGVLEGITSADSAVRIFEGVPFAAPPVGALRWQAPQPAARGRASARRINLEPGVTRAASSPT